jgi:hypothetical protein
VRRPCVAPFNAKKDAPLLLFSWVSLSDITAFTLLLFPVRIHGGQVDGPSAQRPSAIMGSDIAFALKLLFISLHFLAPGFASHGRKRPDRCYDIFFQ